MSGFIRARTPKQYTKINRSSSSINTSFITAIKSIKNSYIIQKEYSAKAIGLRESYIKLPSIITAVNYSVH
jgi:hypothetical protein